MTDADPVLSAIGDELDAARNKRTIDPLLLAIGDELKAARALRGLTREAFAREMNMPANTIACWENAIRPFPIVQLAAMCAKLRTPLPDLLERAQRRVNQDRPMEVSVYVREGDAASVEQKGDHLGVIHDSENDVIGYVIRDAIVISVSGVPVDRSLLGGA